MATPDAETTEVYRFGAAMVDAARRELTLEGKSVALQPKAFGLLVYLIRHRDRAVTKQELQEAVWPRTIVTETALTRAVMKARRAVGDDSETQDVIRTVHGHGYRFVAPLANEAEGPAATTSTDDERGHRSADGPGTWPARKLIGAGLAVLAFALISWQLLLPTQVDAGTARLALMPVENATQDAELDWVELGLMSLMNRMLEGAGVSVAAERTVTRQLDTGKATGPAELLGQLANSHGVSHLVSARLERSAGLLRLHYTIHFADGQEQRTVVGSEVAQMAAEVADNLTNLIRADTLTPRQVRAVSDDPFVNEAYARGLALQLKGDPQAAQSLFEVAVRQDPTLFWPRYELALTRRDLGEATLAATEFQSLLEQAQQLGAAEEQVAVGNALGLLHMDHGREEEAKRALENALAVAESAGHPEDAGIVSINLGIQANAAGKTEQALQFYRRSEQHFLAANLPIPGTLHNNLAGIHLKRGDLAQAETALEKALERFRIIGNRRFEAGATNRLGTLRRRQGSIDEAIQLHEKSLAIRRELDDEIGQISSLLSLAEARDQRGELTRALADAESGLALAAQSNRPTVLADAWHQVGSLKLKLGRYEESEAAFSSALEHARESSPLGLAATLGQARVQHAAGNAAAAQSAGQALAAKARANGQIAIAARAQLFLADTAISRGQMDAAQRALAEARSLADRVPTGLELDVARTETKLALARGDGARARELVAPLRERAEHLADTWRLAAQADFLLGETSSAVTAMEKARERAGESWGEQDAQQLANYRAAAP